MNSFKNPLTPAIEQPVNLDRPIQEMRTALAGLPWLERAFGRSFNAIKSSPGSFGGKKVLVYPHVWQGAGKDLLEVLPNDNLKSYSFFKVEQPIEVLEYVPDGFSIMRARVSIIFWFDLQRIDATINYDFTELLQAEAQRVITSMLFSSGNSVKIEKIWHGAANVFKGYDLNELKDQELIYPRSGFRFETLVTYYENCPINIGGYTPPPYDPSGPVDPQLPGDLVNGEIPAGAIDGVNNLFTTANDIEPGTLTVTLNGLEQVIIEDYQITGLRTFTMNVSPEAGESIVVDYQIRD